MKSSLARNAALTMATAASLASIAFACKFIAKYGLEGSLRLIWEGDHLSPDVREAVDKLDQIERDLLVGELRRIEQVEVSIETAALNSVDGGEGKESYSVVAGQRITVVVVPGIVKKELAICSHSLDTIAGQIDSVQSHGDADVRRRKKDLSKRVVQMMEKVDGLILQVQGDL